MVRLEGEFETESQGRGELEASRPKRGRRLRACFRMCIGNVTSRVTGEQTERDHSYLRNFL